MSLIVTATDLVTIAVNGTAAAGIVADLAAQGRSFYFEPWPNGRARISVNREHLSALLAHADGAHPTLVTRGPQVPGKSRRAALPETV